MAKKTLSPEEAERLEADFTFLRSVELSVEPIKGRFDIDHLKAVNHYLFQDLPKHGLAYTPGEFRPPVPVDGGDWCKQRQVNDKVTYFVAYSDRDERAMKILESTLKQIDPQRLSELKTAEFIKEFATIYAHLDYVHPFRDGNSRTLRLFTKQFAKNAGYSVDWDKLGKSAGGRAHLYLARDLSVNKIALPNIRDQGFKKRVVYMLDSLESYRDIAGLLQDIIKPARVLSFERDRPTIAIKKHPELAAAFTAINRASDYVEKSDKPESERRAFLAGVMQKVKEALLKGDTQNFDMPELKK